MARLPTPGGDVGNWGGILNEYLSVSHDANGRVFGIINVKEFGAKGDGSTIDTTAIQNAIDAAGRAGGGLVFFPPGRYIIDKTLQIGEIKTKSSRIYLDCYSNVWIRGAGMGVTTIKCTNAINGSEHVTHNNVFNANNIDPIRPYQDSTYKENIWVMDMTIDCTNQNASGIPAGRFGTNLCAVEYQNIHRAGALRLKVIKAFGNAVVSGSIDPTMNGAVRGAWIEDCVFDDCCAGGLPQYGGITGSVVQFGAMYGGVIRNCMFMNSGGPAIDFFHCVGTIIESNYFMGGAYKGSDTKQTTNSIHSDFGIANCVIRNNVMYGAGTILLSGLMKARYGLNVISPEPPAGAPPTWEPPANVPGSPGPNGCVIEGNVIRPSAANSGTPRQGCIVIIAGNQPGHVVGAAADNIIMGNVTYGPVGKGIELYDAPNAVNDNNRHIIAS